MIKVVPKHLLDGGGGYHRGTPQEIERESCKLISVFFVTGEGYVAVCERLGEKTYRVKDDSLGQYKDVVEKKGDLVVLRINALRVIESNVVDEEREAYLKEVNIMLFGDKNKGIE
jgi:hypothetical protein